MRAREMEYLNERLEFLDLSNANEKEQCLIEQILFTSNRPFQVPWCTVSEKHNNESNRQLRDDAYFGVHRNIETGHAYVNNLEETKNGCKDARDARNQPTQTEEIYSCHPPNSLSHIQVYPMVPSLPGVFVPSVTTSLNVVHSSYVSQPRIAAENFPVDENVMQNEIEDRKQSSSPNRPTEVTAHGQQPQQQQPQEPILAGGGNVGTRYQPHLATLQAAMQPYYLQGSPTGTILYMQPAVFSPQPQVFDPYAGRPSPTPVYRPQQQAAAPPAPRQQQQQPQPQQQQQPQPQPQHQQIEAKSSCTPIVDVSAEQGRLVNDCNIAKPIESTELIVDDNSNNNINNSNSNIENDGGDDNGSGSSKNNVNIINNNNNNNHNNNNNNNNNVNINNISNNNINKNDNTNAIDGGNVAEFSNLENIAAGRQKHEHLCYHTEVVVKLPPKKKPANLETYREREGQPASDQAESVPADALPKANPVPVPNQQSQQQQNKSWASLFNSSSAAAADKVRPMARVSPRIKTDSTMVDPANYKVSNSSRIPSSSIGETRLKRLGEFLSEYEPDHKIVSLQPRGLTNRNNWCYVNAILQSLIACPPFYNLMKAMPIESGKRYSEETLILDNLHDFVREFLPANARIGKREKSARNRDGEMNGAVEIFTGAAFEPSGIYKILDKLRGENCFDIEGRQEDAEEFLSCLLNGLNDEMFELIKAVKKPKDDEEEEEDAAAPPARSKESKSDTEEDSAAWTVMGPKNKSSVTRRAVCGKTPISDIFRGQTRCRVLKAGDQTPTDTVQPFFTLQLDIEKAASVKEALELLVGKDELQGVTCSKTHRQVEAWTQTTLEDLPIVLILHLKCFLYKPDGCFKIVKTLDFPVDLKIDVKHMSCNRKNKYNSKQRSYKLIAVIYHDGKEATKGHYVTDAYHVGYGCWIRYDDGAVRSVPESQVLRPRPPRVPYLLYYRRGDTVGTAK